MLQHFINHISLIVDKSSSMSGQDVVKVFDKELNYLKKRSVELNQETRISIYLFADYTECLTFDMDVMRFNSLEGYWKPYGMTALIDAVLKSIEDNKKLPQLYGDHAFLQYVITDGCENRSSNYASTLKSTLDKLGDNWTTACLVPDKNAAEQAARFGFNKGAISVWDTSKSFDLVGNQFSKTIDSYMDMRSRGVRGTKTLFEINTDGLTKSKLDVVLKKTYDIFPVSNECVIKDFVETVTGKAYRLGSVYHQPVKPIVIQDYKDILVQNVKDKKVYSGNDLRQLLGLPNDTAKVTPGNHKEWRIFVQSTSTNRKLLPNTYILVKK